MRTIVSVEVTRYIRKDIQPKYFAFNGFYKAAICR